MTTVEKAEYFVETIDEDGMITYRLYANVSTAILLGRANLRIIHSNPKGAGFGTKMLHHTEKKALEKGSAKITVSAIADEEKIKHFFEKNEYKLSPDLDCAGESVGEKILKQ